jgi:hypothetical protein
VRISHGRAPTCRGSRRASVPRRAACCSTST